MTSTAKSIVLELAQLSDEWHDIKHKDRPLSIIIPVNDKKYFAKFTKKMRLNSHCLKFSISARTDTSLTPSSKWLLTKLSSSKTPIANCLRFLASSLLVIRNVLAWLSKYFQSLWKFPLSLKKNLSILLSRSSRLFSALASFQNKIFSLFQTLEGRGARFQIILCSFLIRSFATNGVIFRVSTYFHRIYFVYLCNRPRSITIGLSDLPPKIPWLSNLPSIASEKPINQLSKLKFSGSERINN